MSPYGINFVQILFDVMEHTVYFIIGLSTGALLMLLVLRMKAGETRRQTLENERTRIQSEAEMRKLREELNRTNIEKQDLRTRLEISEADNAAVRKERVLSDLKLKDVILEKMELAGTNAALQEKLSFQKEEVSRLQQQAVLQFESIAHKLLEEKSQKFTQANQLNIQAVLQPLNENISSFKKQVEETYEKESRIRFSLDERIRELMEQTNRISSEANNLANALKGNHKRQGDWGEMILESILQKSGLIKDREYRVQTNLENAEGRNVRPDIIVDMPDSRSIVIDSKVSLNAYDVYCSAAGGEEQQLALQSHLKAVRAHVDDLSAKNYHELVNGLDFTMLFIPVEPAYLLAMQHDANLWNDAYRKRILLMSPTNLIACLKLIVDLWNRDKQDKSAQKIVKQAEKIYDKVVLFTRSFEQVGKQLQQAQESYLRAQNQLKEGRGNVLSQTNRLMKYGITPKNVLKDVVSEEEEEDTVE